MNHSDRPGQQRKYPRAHQQPKTSPGLKIDAATKARWQTLAAVLVVVVAGVVFYSNTFSSPFVFDDKGYLNIIAKRLQQLWPPWAPLAASIRPVVDFSFVLNIAVHGFRCWGYHAVNLAIHLAAALTLFGLVRRTLSRGTLAQRYGQAAWGLALGTALLWLVHPLQTESVTYIYQRFESLMGLCFLVTFYCFLRAQDSPRAGWWYAGSVAACLLAVGSKEVAVVIPPLLVWYDRAFLASSWRELLRKRWPFYAALAGVMVLLALLVIRSIPVYVGGGMFKVKDISWLDYSRTQPGVILHYLRLSVWPQGQCLDYGWTVAKTFVEIVPPLLILLGLIALTAWCIWRHPAWGFLGGWFFLVLAPSSSFIPIRDPAFEHRMYLPLAAVLLALVIGGYELLRRLPIYRASTPFEQRLFQIAPLLIAIVALGSATYARNYVYRSDIAIWEDVVAKRPQHRRGHNNLGLMYMLNHQRQLALDNFYTAIKLDPDYYDPHFNLGVLLSTTNPDEAIKHFTICLKAHEWFVPTCHYNLAILLQNKGDLKQARHHLEIAVQLDGTNAAFRDALAAALAAQNDFQGAIKVYDESLRIKRDNFTAMVGKATVLDWLGRRAEAVQYCRQALESHPDSPDLLCQLAKLLPPEDPEALRHLQLAVKYRPRFASAHDALGDRLANAGNLPAAISEYQKVLQIHPGFDEVRKKLNALVRVYQQQQAQP